MTSKQDVNIEPIANLRKDIIHGIDISSIISLEESGVTFYNYDGEVDDPFTIFSKAGVNYIRVKVWNDPYDSKGRGYGGGTSDLDKAIKIGERATKNDMKLLVNFHYSDFWADPSSQRVPKGWSTYSFEEKETALYEYTLDSLNAMKEKNIDIGMVQVGNETNFSFCGEVEWDKITQLFKSGSKAVREVLPEAKIVLHFADPQTPGLYRMVSHILEKNDVDYDVFASSYYPFWHGTKENVAALLSSIATKHNKEVMIAETAYPYTFESGDGQPTMIRPDADVTFPFEISLQGQVDALRTAYEVVADIGNAALGVFYWEPAWLPVGPPSEIENNKKVWEKKGSGWATSYSLEYKPDDATLADEYGGSSVDNQALFDFKGHPLPSLKFYRDIHLS